MLIVSSLRAYSQWQIDVVDVYDGDTITANIHLPFNVTLSNQKIRLLYINATELKGVDEKSKQIAIKSKEYLQELLKETPIYLYTDAKQPERDSFGRILGILKTKTITINKKMIEQGHAVKYVPKQY